MFHKKRKSSSIYNMRKFHNWVKRQLILQSADLLRKDYRIQDISLLDLANGHGGDNLKYIDSKINTVYGFDIDHDSIHGPNGAIDRFKKLNNKNLNYNFYEMDLSKESNFKLIQNILMNRKFNIVSCQFAIHYFFENSESLDNLIKIVSTFIENNGLFIGTTLNGILIKDKLKLQNNNTIQNYLYNIKSISDLNNDHIYGNKCIVSLGAKSDTDHYFSDKDSVEYLFDINELKKVCERYGLMFIGTLGFDEWHINYTKTEINNKMSDAEKEFSFLNMSFVFMKKN